MLESSGAVWDTPLYLALRQSFPELAGDGMTLGIAAILPRLSEDEVAVLSSLMIKEVDLWYELTEFERQFVEMEARWSFQYKLSQN